MSLLPVFCEVHVARGFLCNFLYIIVCRFVLFQLVVNWSTLLWLTVLNPRDKLSVKTQTQAMLDCMFRNVYDIYIDLYDLLTLYIEYNSVHETLLECFEIYISKRVLIARTLIWTGSDNFMIFPWCIVQNRINRN